MKPVVCGVMIIMMCLLCPVPQSLGDSIEKQNIAAIGQHIDLGIVSIPWSRANSYFGYIYPVNGLSVANIDTGPQTWKTKGYNSYKGESSWDQMDDLPSSNLSSPNMIVFPCSETKPATETFGGILIFHYKNHTGAVEFLRIDSAGLHYRYRIFSAESDSLTVTGNTEPSVINYNDAHTYEICPENPIPAIHISNNSSVILLPGSSPIDSVSIIEGTLILKGPGEYIMGDVKIHKKGRFRLVDDAVLRITGDWDNSGEFDTFSGQVIFDGDRPQTISGDTSFYSLEIDTRYQVATDNIHVEELSVHSGIFIPGTQSQIRNGYISSDGLMMPEANGVLYITGNIYNDGGFIHNCGRVVLNGTVRQYIRMGYYPFYILDIKNTDVYWETPLMMDEENMCP
ncbi:MAG: hypothetical protein HUN04_13925 [Desulfobacter sp.]|nr:MAG: hypothetical protein HUN04_13925 [Desulfobacter sp.]